LLAAALKLAVDDARAADAEARAWLFWLLPEHAELDSVHEALISMGRERR
jgi:hypothetical protein